jgi:methyl-accepting chemotaxis protein
MHRAEETARAMSEVSTGVQRIAESSGVVAESSNIATINDKRGNESVHKAMEQMESIHTSTENMAVNIQMLGEQSGRVAKL